MMENTLIPDYGLRDALLGVITDNKGSDFYYTVGTYPAVKISGEIILIDEEMAIITPEDTEKFAKSLITEEQHEQLLETKNLDFSFMFQEFRFRGNISFQMGYYMIVLRLLSQHIPTLQDLKLPFIYEEITRVGQGLVLVT
jgi:Tfp pilus assembly pilus retraction ATPase PilT